MCFGIDTFVILIDGLYQTPWLKLASTINLTCLGMTELYALPVMFVLCAGNQLMNHGMKLYGHKMLDFS